MWAKQLDEHDSKGADMFAAQAVAEVHAMGGAGFRGKSFCVGFG